jgi:hypothetical protein
MRRHISGKSSLPLLSGVFQSDKKIAKAGLSLPTGRQVQMMNVCICNF